jgi:3-hydroxyacyl-[acyl-carrier-protein] dehydratase
LNSFQTETIVPADHPCLAGHFPGNPLVPGVVILDEVITAVAEVWPDCRAAGISSAKFVRPLRPGQTMVVEATRVSDQSIRFSCRHEGITVAQGVLEISRD